MSAFQAQGSGHPGAEDVEIPLEAPTALDEELRADAELETRAKARIGAILRDKYRLDYILGLGGAATVYAATHRNGKRVALKLMHPELSAETDVRDRFLREGYVANKVKHPGAVAVLDDDVTEERWAFLVMERLDGITVQTLWEAWSFRLGAPLVTAITLELLDVMAAAHAQGVVHRDLKPDNLFLTRDGGVKVLDFGIARMLHVSARKTNVGQVLGTPAYMAPEQANSEAQEIDGKTDQWAIASIAFALLVGDVVHPAANAGKTLIHAATRPARALGPLAPEAPPAIVAVLERALAFDKADRWPSAAAMRDALAHAAGQAYGDVPGVNVVRDALRGLVEPLREVAPYDGEGSSVSSAPVVVSTSAEAPRMLAEPSLGSRSARTVVLGDAARAPSTASPGFLAGRGVVALAALAAAALFVAFLLLRVPVSATATAAGAGSTPPPPRAPATEPPAPSTADPVAVAPATAAAEPEVAPPPTVPSAAPPRAVESAPAHARTAVSPAPHATKPSSAAGTAPPTAAGACTPPFVIEPDTGRKRWKTECL